MVNVKTKRVYEPKARGDGQRVLVDRVWPRGIAKETLADAIWMKDVAPSSDLRKWFGHDPERWSEFRRRYKAELKRNPEPVLQLRALAKQKPVTLLYSAKDEDHNQAVVLAEVLEING